MNIKDFNDTLLYSNKNQERMMRNLINESCNAVLLETYGDKCYLADHTTGQIFEAKYNFDGNVLTFSDFNEITLERDNSSLKEAIGAYFDDEVINLTEAYEKANASTTDNFEDSLAEALSTKNMSKVIDYSEISGLTDDAINEAKNTEAFKVFSERLEEVPTDNVKMFDWKNPVKISIIDEDKNKFVSKSAKAKINKIKKTADFKKKVLNASKKLISENDVSGFEDLIAEEPTILALDKSELKESIGLAIVSDKDLMVQRNVISEEVENLINGNEELSAKRRLYEEDKEGSDTDAPEASEKDVDAFVKALETAKEKATDEKLASKIDDIISSLKSSSESGETDVSAVKEAVELLSL